MKYVGDNNKWEQLCRKFRDCTNNAILLCYDDPAEPVYKMLFAFDVCDSNGGTSEYACQFYEVEPYKIGLIVNVTRSDRVVFQICGEEEYSKFIYTNFELPGAWDKAAFESLDLSHSTFLGHAKLSARQARFEHGEKPII